MQAARGLVDLAVELSARMQRGHDDLERGLVAVLGMRIHGNAAPVVGNAQRAVRGERDLDPARMAGDRLVHGIVDHFGEEVVQRAFVGSADIHARTPANRLQPLQHLDVGCRVVGRLASVASNRLPFRWPGARRRLLGRCRSPGGSGGGVEQVVVCGHAVSERGGAGSCLPPCATRCGRERQRALAAHGCLLNCESTLILPIRKASCKASRAVCLRLRAGTFPGTVFQLLPATVVATDPERSETVRPVVEEACMRDTPRCRAGRIDLVAAGMLFAQALVFVVLG